VDDEAAIDEGVPAPVLTRAIRAFQFARRRRLSGQVAFGMRYGFGGHLEKSAK